MCVIQGHGHVWDLFVSIDVQKLIVYINSYLYHVFIMTYAAPALRYGTYCTRTHDKHWMMSF